MGGIKLNDRQINICALLMKEGPLSPSDLAQRVGGSPSTIYNDIDLLESLRIKRKSGVVRIVQKDDRLRGTEAGNRLRSNQDLKIKMAEHIVENYITRKSRIFLDSGGSCYYIAQKILEKNIRDITLVTTNPLIGNLFFHSYGAPNLEIVGGTLSRGTASIFGPLCKLTLDAMADFETVFLGVDYFSWKKKEDEDNTITGEIGLATDIERTIKHILIRKAASLVVPLDEDKLGKRGYSLLNLYSSSGSGEAEETAYSSSEDEQGKRKKKNVKIVLAHRRYSDNVKNFLEKERPFPNTIDLFPT